MATSSCASETCGSSRSTRSPFARAGSPAPARVPGPPFPARGLATNRGCSQTIARKKPVRTTIRQDLVFLTRKWISPTRKALSEQESGRSSVLLSPEVFARCKDSRRIAKRAKALSPSVPISAIRGQVFLPPLSLLPYPVNPVHPVKKAPLWLRLCCAKLSVVTLPPPLSLLPYPVNPVHPVKKIPSLAAAMPRWVRPCLSVAAIPRG